MTADQDIPAPLPYVSIVIPTRNRARLLRDCIDSLMGQDFPRDAYEIIVVDDGSKDETPQIVSMAAALSGTPKVSYVHQEPGGLNSARNAGLQRAVGDPIVFVDDDVLAPPTWLRAIVEGSLRYKNAGCLGGPVRLRLEGKPPRLCGRDSLGESDLDLGESEKFVDFVIGANMAVRREAIETIGPFNEELPTYGDEIEWEVRLTRAGGRILYVPGASLLHRRTQSDLRVWRLIRARFKRGSAHAVFSKAVGQRVNLFQELKEIPRFLAHAARHACAGGLLSASVRAGRAWGIVLQRFLLSVDKFRSTEARVGTHPSSKSR